MKTKQIPDYHIVQNIAALGVYTGAQFKIILADGRQFNRVTSSATVDNVVCVAVAGSSGERFMLQGIPIVTPDLLPTDPTATLNLILTNTTANAVELRGAHTNIGRLVLNSKVLSVPLGSSLTFRAMTSAEQSALGGFYGGIDVSAGGRITGAGILDFNKSVRTGTQNYGIYGVGSTQDVVIQGVTIKNCAGDAIRFQQCGNLSVNNTSIVGCDDHGIHLITSSNIQISSVRVNGGTHGIHWEGDDNTGYSEGISITDAQVQNVSGGGIWGHKGKGVTINGGYAIKCGDVGIDFERCVDSVATGVYVRDSTNAALAVFNACTNIQFVGCMVRQNAGFGPGFKAFGNNDGGSGRNTNISVIGGSITCAPDVNPVNTDQDTCQDVKLVGVTMSGSYVQFLDCNDVQVKDCTLTTASALGIWQLGGKNGIFSNNKLFYTGSGTANEFRSTFRSTSYSATGNIWENNKAYGFTGGCLDEDTADGTNVGGASSGNIFLSNLTATAVVQPSGKPNYSLLKKGNYRLDGSFIEKWTDDWLNTITPASETFTPFLTLPTSTAGTYDNAVVLVTLGGFGGGTKKRFTLAVGQRDGLVVNAFLQGDNVNSTAVEAYTQTGGVTTFFIHTVGISAQLSVQYMQMTQATGVYKLVPTATTPTGTLVYSTNSNLPNLEVGTTGLKRQGYNLIDDAKLPVDTAMLSGQWGIGDRLEYRNGKLVRVPQYVSAVLGSVMYAAIAPLLSRTDGNNGQFLRLTIVSLGNFQASNLRSDTYYIATRGNTTSLGDSVWYETTDRGGDTNATRPANLVIYQNADGTGVAYLKVTSGFNAIGFYLDSIVNSGSYSPITSGSFSATVPSGTLVYDSATVVPANEILPSKSLIAGKRTHDNNWFPTKETMTPVNGDTLTYNGSTAQWENKPGLAASPVTANTFQAVTNTLIITNNTSQKVVITLPLNANSSIGDPLIVGNLGGLGWTLAQNAGDQIIGPTAKTTVGTGGSLSSSGANPTVSLRKVAANTWQIFANEGAAPTYV